MGAWGSAAGWGVPGRWDCQTALAAAASAGVWAVKSTALLPAMVSSTDWPPNEAEATVRTSAPNASSHQLSPTSPTEPSARAITGRPSIFAAPRRSDSTLATPLARALMRSANVRVRTYPSATST